MTDPPREPTTGDSRTDDESAEKPRADFFFPEITARTATVEDPRETDDGQDESEGSIRWGYRRRLDEQGGAAEKTVLERFTRPPVLVALLASLVATASFCVWFVMRESPDVTAAQEEIAVRLDIYLVAQGVEAHRDSTGALPPNLRVLDLDDEDVQYETDGESYSLSTTVNGGTLVLNDGDDLDAWGETWSVAP